jgi:hypothetical protein
MGRISKRCIATWTLTVVHPATSGAGVDSPKRCGRPHWMMAKGHTRKMKASWHPMWSGCKLSNAESA